MSSNVSGLQFAHEVGNLTFAEVCNPGDSPMDCIKAAACAPSCFAALVSYEDNVAYDALFLLGGWVPYPDDQCQITRGGIDLSTADAGPAIASDINDASRPPDPAFGAAQPDVDAGCD
jgi:hypothetical protein